MPKLHHLLCMFLCLAGIGMLSLSGGWAISSGDIVTVLSGVPYAVNIVISARLIATALCLYMQTYGLKYAEPAIGGMLLSLESVFGVMFSVIVYHEKITFRMLVGFAVIFAAILLAQWDGKTSLDK